MSTEAALLIGITLGALWFLAEKIWSKRAVAEVILISITVIALSAPILLLVSFIQRDGLLVGLMKFIGCVAFFSLFSALLGMYGRWVDKRSKQDHVN